MKKLKLNKEKIAKLSREQSSSVVGGGSTNHNFTCGWCTTISQTDNCNHTQQQSRPECDCGTNPNAPTTNQGGTDTGYGF